MMDRDMHYEQGDDENLPNPLQQGLTSRNSENQVSESNSETVIVIGSEETEVASGEDGKLKTKIDILETSMGPGEEPKVNALEPEKHVCIIDIRGDGRSLSSSENFNMEKVCRICHLSSQHSSRTTNLVLLGCGCKGELGISHRRCAETWFKRKGNTICEICGGTAKNITVIEEAAGFGPGLNERRLMIVSAMDSSEREDSRRWRDHFCQFLLACLVLAFIFPWFFRINSI